MALPPHLQNSNEAATGVPGVDGLWEDGEWVSWDVVVQEREDRFGDDNVYECLLAIAIDYEYSTERHFPVYGELGEIYAERRFSVERHPPGTPGSDGRIGNVLVEIKTISPHKTSKAVRVKRAGNFGALILVKFDDDYRVDAKVISRKNLPKGTGKWINVKWDDIRCERKDFETEPPKIADPLSRY